MKIHVTKEWCERSAEIEGNSEIRAGCPPATDSPRFDQFAGFLVPDGHAVFGGMTVHPIIDRHTCGPIDGYPTESQWFAVAFSPTDQERIAAALNGDNVQVMAAPPSTPQDNAQR